MTIALHNEQPEPIYTITLTGVIQLLSKCSVFPISGGKRAPTEESNKCVGVQFQTA